MKENIDNLYNRKLKGVETRPPEEVWKNIASRLPQKKVKRRVLPLWYRLGGIAAAIALLVLLGNTFYAPVDQPENRVVMEDPSEEMEEEGKPESKSEFKNNNEASEKGLVSSKVSENLISQSKNQPETNPKPKRADTNISPARSYFSEIPQQPEPSLAVERFSFSKFNDLAFQEEIQQQLENQATIESILEEVALVDYNDNDEEETDKSLKFLNRLSISPTAAAVYSDHMGSGNSIDKSLANNTSTGEISMAYGLQVGVQLSEKLKLRTGVNKVDLGYNTQEVNFASALNATAFGGSGGSDTSAEPAIMLSNTVSGSLNQRMGFIEIPVEFEYALSSKKFGLNLIAGGSTLFLDDNMVSLNSSQLSTNLGKAQNINSVSYSANIGLGFNYRISQKLQWNLEPVFKYQLNTFTNTKDVNPYFLGLYSGLNFKF
ncbi:MAG: outer membrane beta-barrel protein [Gillisia sp.]